MMFSQLHKWRQRLVEKGDGQGLVEYALVLVLVAIVVIVSLSLVGRQLNVAYCQVISGLQGGDGSNCTTDEETGIVIITQARFQATHSELWIRATFNGGVEDGVTLTASPGGGMQQRDAVYTVEVPWTAGNCPVEVTVTSSTGASDSVTITDCN
ncbi:MAG TPA: hypothetical protein VLL52_16610 [Anaerolineae bacterium]|nr:hypothetical protein [Anaerolineae bacterium]